MGRHEFPEDLVLTEAQLRAVIERATRAEPRPEGTSIAVLRQIAAELDIDPAALERALDEVVGLPVRGKPVHSWINRRVTRLGHALDLVLPRKGRLAAGLLLGGSLGWLSAEVALGLRLPSGMGSSGSGAFVDVPITIALVLLTLANSLSRRLDGRFARYLAELAATWGAFVIAWGVTAGGVSGDLARGALLISMAAAVWGWLVVRRKSAGGPDTPERVLPVTPVRADATKAEEPLRSTRASWEGLISPTMIGLAKP